ncbi:MAG: pyruvate formate lyase family protein, partial [Peptococcia bacterium]
MKNVWQDFKAGNWTETIDVRDFIQQNYNPYEGTEDFLQGPTNKTKKLWAACEELLQKEAANGGILDIDTRIVAGIDAYEPGYIDQVNEVIVGLQTDQPLKRSVNPYGGIRMAKEALEAYGYEVTPEMEYIFSHYRKTHNQGVFDAYTPEIRALRSAGVLTGLPDTYGRGRIIGDYRRIPLYGISYLIEQKRKDIL